MTLRVPIIGTPFGDIINMQNDAFQFPYQISTFGGNDIVTGGNLSDIIDGGDGNDQLFGAGGDDALFGGNGNDMLSGGLGNDQLSGGSGNDQVFGGSGNDSLSGGSGNDLLAGGTGRDVMSGGVGADTFRFDSVADSVRGAGRDIITDFVQGADHINVNLIDANSHVAGNQNFSFIGAAAFTGAAGQLRAESQLSADGHGITIVQADTNGDHVADMEIQLTGNYALNVNDFIL